MTSPDTSSCFFILADKYALRVSNKNARPPKSRSFAKLMPNKHKPTNSPGHPPPAFLFLLTTLSKSRENMAKEPCPQPLMEANAPSGVKRSGGVGPGNFPVPSPLRFKKLMREHKKTAGKAVRPRNTLYLQITPAPVKHPLRGKCLFTKDFFIWLAKSARTSLKTRISPGFVTFLPD